MPLLIYLFIQQIDPFYIAGTPMDRFILLFLVINALAPALSMLIMLRFGMISSLEAGQRSERFAPFMLVIFYYIVSFGLLWWKNPGFPDFVLRFFASVIFSLSFALLINMRWKISVHMIAQGSLTGCLLAIRSSLPTDGHWLIAGALLLAAWIGFARLQLNAHSPRQVYAGYAVGVIVTWAVIGSPF